MKIETMIPNPLLKELYDLIRQEHYVDLYSAFPDSIDEDLDHLMLNSKQAHHLLWATELEHSRACLKYPYRIDDEQPFDPEHEEQFDDVQHFYQKMDFYLSLAIKMFEELENQEDQQ